MHNLLKKGGLFTCAALSTTFLNASEPEAFYELDDYVVSAGPSLTPVTDFASPISILSEDEIRREGAATLGDLLDSQPGVSASSFTGGASRPILRGFDGPRVKILDSGVEATDVSETSPDHGVAVEPLLVERVEVLRGPATLLYGSSAIGGAVNVIGRKLPRKPLSAENSAEGAAEFRVDSVSDGRTFLGYTSVGAESWAINITALDRENEDYDTPDGIQTGTFVETQQLSFGSSWFFNGESYIGASFSNYESFYGVPEEDEEVSIDLDQDRFDTELAIIQPSEWIEALRLKFSYTDYLHTELEGDEIGTVFERDGWEVRGEIAHAPLGRIDKGVIGFQASDLDLDAIGEEAFIPASNTENQAIFISEHAHFDPLHFELGGRIELQEVSAQGAADDYDETAFSIASSVIFEIDEVNSIALSLQRSERHATATELFADGRHLATQQFELGDPTLDIETAYSADLTFRHEGRNWNASLSAFYTDFSDFIFLNDTGTLDVEPGEDDLPIFEFIAVDAVFWGFEAELGYTATLSNDATLKLGFVGDYVNAENDDNGDNLPRIPPVRIGANASLDWKNWHFGAKIKHAFEQNDTAPGETDTGEYTNLRFDIEHTIELSNSNSLTFFAKVDNLLDEEIRDHTSFLKDEVLLPGRNFTFGGRFEF